MATPLRFGLIGCGTIAETHANALAAIPSDALLVSCCDTIPEKADAFSRKYQARVATFSEILADPGIDAVSICTPSGIHAAQAVDALQAGKHVIIEKPMDVSVEACDRIIRAQQETGRTLSIIVQHRFDPASQLVRKTIESGELGDLLQAEVQIPWYRTQEYYDSGDWRGTWELDGGGCVMNQGIHTVDLLRWFCGPVQSVFAVSRSAAHERIQVEDLLSAVIEFKSGAVATLSASTSAYPGFAARIAVYGKEGSAIITGDSLERLVTRAGKDICGSAATLDAIQVATGGTRAANAGVSRQSAPEERHWGDSHRRQFLDFILACRTGRNPAVDGIAGREAVELVTALYQSAKTGRKVQLGRSEQVVQTAGSTALKA